MRNHTQFIIGAIVTSFLLSSGVWAAIDIAPADDRDSAPAGAWKPAPSDWPTFHNDNTRTGVTAANAAMKLPYYKWSVKTNMAVMSSPAVVTIDTVTNGTTNSGPKVIIGSGDGRIYCIDGRSGNILWRYQATSYIFSSPAVGDLSGDGKPKVVFGCQDDRIYCLDCTNGSLVWRYTTRNVVRASPALADLNGDGKLETAIGSIDGKMYVLDDRGQLVWAAAVVDSGIGVASAAAIGDANGDGKPEVVVQAAENNVSCLAGSDGKELWRYTGLNTFVDTLNSPIIADLDADNKNEVLAFGNTSHACCLDGQTGRVKWIKQFQITLQCTPSVADVNGDFRLEIVAADDSGVICIDGAGGNVSWTHSYASNQPTVLGSMDSSAALADIDGDGRLEIIVGASDRKLHILNAEDGSARSIFPVQQPIQSSPAIADIDSDGKAEIVFGCNDNRVYALDYNF